MRSTGCCGRRWNLSLVIAFTMVLPLLLSCPNPQDDGSSPSPSPSPPVVLTPTAPAVSDLDGDGFAVEDGDCDDNDPAINPDSEEVPYDGIDQDCSGADLTDVDGDGFDAVEADGPDCADTDPDTYPGAPEIGDGLDNDCDGEVDEDVDSVDNDGDGYSEKDGDCDDDNPSIHPEAPEIPYDGVDQDCSGSDLTDVDGDGYEGGPEATDCDDTDPAIHPGTVEVPYDGIDQDCSGSDLTDVDEDGYPGGADGSDCVDTDPAIHPDQEEIPYDGIDQDCSGSDLTDVDQDGQDAEAAGGMDCNDQYPTLYAGATEIPYDGIDQDCSGTDLTDVDGDTFEAAQVDGTDCDDTDANTYPGASEFADGKDNDCDGEVDENLSTTDDDDDGFTDADGDCNDYDATIYPGATEIPYDGVDQDCSGTDLTDVDGDGVAGGLEGSDCDDTDPDIHPGADEIPYDGIDQDCSGADLTDVDGDGFDATDVSGGTDCDDDDPASYPGATEIPYDGIDQDCSGTDLTDVDGDGFDASAAGGSDCNDALPEINPDADEVCDGEDNNCDGVVDLDAIDRNTYFIDGDRDGYGDPNQPQLACTATDPLVVDNTDCDDTSADNNPAATEVCDGEDNDCDGNVDEDVLLTFFEDADGDGYGNPHVSQQACTTPDGYSDDSSDCDDTSATIYPGAPEVCNGLDDDCDDAVDEDVLTLFYQDADGDGVGTEAVTTLACTPPTGYVAAPADGLFDCDDTTSAVAPGLTETADGLDNDCDGDVDEGVYFASCKALHQALPDASSGVYTIDPDGPGAGVEPFDVYCDMDGDGGWTLVIKIDGASAVFAYDSAIWTNTETYQADHPDFDMTEAKLASFYTVPFDEVRVGLVDGSLRWITLPVSASSLYDIIHTGEYHFVDIPRTTWESLVNNPSLQPNCNTRGFNAPGNLNHSRVRIGITGNQENDCNSCDSYIGIGGHGQGCGTDDAGISAGNWMTCEASVNKKLFGYVMVR